MTAGWWSHTRCVVINERSAVQAMAEKILSVSSVTSFSQKMTSSPKMTSLMMSFLGHDIISPCIWMQKHLHGRPPVMCTNQLTMIQMDMKEKERLAELITISVISTADHADHAVHAVHL